MLSLPLFVACASIDLTDVPVTVAGPTEEKAPPVDSAVLTPETSLDVEVIADGVIEVRPYDRDDEGLVSIGDTLVAAGVVADVTTLSLPVPRAVGEPVLYSVALRAMDVGGGPGVYTGVAAMRLAWVTSEPPDGASSGWNLVLGEGEAALWRPLSDGIVLDENLVGSLTLEVAGTSTLAMSPDTRLSLSENDDPLPVSVWDASIGADWAVSIVSPPPVAARLATEAYVGALLTFHSYEDEDGDGMRVLEPVTGRACFGAEPATIAWFSETWDLETAHALRDGGYRSGWDVLIDGADGPRPASGIERRGLTLAASCE